MTYVNVKRIAQEVDTLLKELWLVDYAIHDEARRCLNLGIPLAEMINHGFIQSLSKEGRRVLLGSHSDLQAIYQVAREHKSGEHVLSNPARDMWRRVDALRVVS